VPFGCGRPIWVDDDRFDIRNHVGFAECPVPGDDRALYDLAAHLVTTRLDDIRPLWAATLISGVAGGQWSLVVVFHHVLADGIGGLVILAHLVDGTATSAVPRTPRGAPGRWDLSVDAAAARLSALVHLPRALRLFGAGIAQILPGVTVRAARTALNRPTGPRRRLTVARASLDAVRTVAHAHGATVNDVVLAAVPAALRAVQLRHGEDLTRVVVSVPVSARSPNSTALGNQVGAVPVALPATGSAVVRLEETARIMRARKRGSGGASAAVLAPAFRLLVTLGLLRWFVDHQRMINTFVTNLRGPVEPLMFLGARVLDIVVVNGTTGNVSVAFGVLSYAGTVNVTIVADPDVYPDQDALTGVLQHELDAIVALASAAGG
jgi:diacylglycerol O-acyltransferase / wax synthase